MASKTQVNKLLAKWAKQSKHKPVYLDDLEYLELPVLLPGEPAPQVTDHFTEMYRPDGTPYGVYSDDMDAFTAVWEEVMRVKATSGIVSSPFYRHGVRISVSTAYLGLAHNLWGKVPLFWETMVFTGSRGGSDGFCQRYASKAAAYHGHAQIVYSIAQAQRERRDAWKNRPRRRH